MTGLLISALVMCNAFQGSIASHLSQRPKSADINTLHELIKSDLKISSLVLIPDLCKPNEDKSNVNEVQKKLNERQSMNVDVKRFSNINEMKKISKNEAFLDKRTNFCS